MSEELHNSERKEYEANPYGKPEDYKDTRAEKANNNHESDANSSSEIKHAREKAQELAESSDDLRVDQNASETKASEHHGPAFPEFSKAQAINRVRKHLSKADRAFSKVIHNPTIEAISDVTGSTVARPSGLLYGGIFSLIASLVLYLITKHYGYEYSFFVAIITFIGGFIFGLVVEILSKLFKKSSS